MANHTTRAQRINARHDKIWREAERLNTQTRFNASSRADTMETQIDGVAATWPPELRVVFDAEMAKLTPAVIVQANWHPATAVFVYTIRTGHGLAVCYRYMDAKGGTYGNRA